VVAAYWRSFQQVAVNASWVVNHPSSTGIL
jgi:hypothetical protein